MSINDFIADLGVDLFDIKNDHSNLVGPAITVQYILIANQKSIDNRRFFDGIDDEEWQSENLLMIPNASYIEYDEDGLDIEPDYL